MSVLVVSRAGPLRGRLRVSGDKSISVRAVLIGALAAGTSTARGWLEADDSLAALDCVRRLGVEAETRVESDDGQATARLTTLVVHGYGLRGLREPADVLDCRGSGTAMRLLAGILAGQSFYSVLTGNDQLRRRPMARVAEPLRQMGATILGRDGGRLPPLSVLGGGLRGIDYALPVASAQVKSAILLAALFADGVTAVREPAPTRDHTERMLRAAGVEVDGPHPNPPPHAGEGVGAQGRAPVRVRGAAELRPLSLQVPGDFSSAAFFLVAACLVPGSELVVEGVGVNPTRTGLLDLLAHMGAQVRIENARESGGEPVADLAVTPAELRGVEVGGEVVPRAIDEFPILAVAATQARGETLVRDAAELRVKESDRVAAVVGELRKMGARIEERPDGFVVEGPARLRGALVDSHGDHRLAMALAIAGLVADGDTTIDRAEAVSKSFPEFERCLRSLQKPAW